MIVAGVAKHGSSPLAHCTIDADDDRGLGERAWNTPMEEVAMAC